MSATKEYYHDEIEEGQRSSALQLRWECRYSETDLPDRHNRWARKCFYKDLHIAWVSRVEHMGTVLFRASTYFPTSGNDMPLFITNYKSFKEAKEGIEYQWVKFTEIIK
jgi:hypothetical protein